MIFIYVGPDKVNKIADHHAIVKDALKHYGFQTIYTDTITDARAKPDDLWIGNLSKVHRDWGAIEQNKLVLPKKYIIWYFTPVRFDHVVELQHKINEAYGLLDNAQMIITYEDKEIEMYTAELDFPKNKCHYVPCGYSPFYETYFPPKHDLPKTIDIYFFAANSPRRQRWVDHLRKNNLNIYWSGENDETPCVFEQERSDLISKAKIVIYICPQPQISIGNASARIGYLISNKVFTILEGNKYSSFMEDLKDYVPTFYSKDEMVKLCAHWLNVSETDKRQITETAYNFLKSKYNFREMMPINEIRRIHDEQIQ